jgi:hypothetical protein
VRFVLSEEFQDDVVTEAGFIPITARVGRGG